MDKTELMKDVLKVTGIAPIIAYAEPEQAVPAAKALVAGGLPVVEVLMRNEHAMGNLERIARDVPEIVAGAGTIITLDQAKAAIDHGAQFIIMPGIGRQVVEYCIDKKIPVIPNCITPGEMTMAVEYGLDMVKFFPIYQLGGLDNVVFRLGFAQTRRDARQLVSHAHFTVNGKKVNIPSYLIKAGDVIEVRESSRSSAKFAKLTGPEAPVVALPSWLDREAGTLKGVVNKLPERSDIDYEVAEHLIVELYSK